MVFAGMEADKLHEECGVIGVYAPGSDVAQLAYFGLFALQHRGQESAGIAVADGNTIKGEKGVGLVSDVFQDTGKLEQLQGQIALGHVLYAANTDGLPANAQPLLMRYATAIWPSHNGQLVNGQLRCQLEDEGSIFQTNSDSEVMAHLIARSGKQILLLQ